MSRLHAFESGMSLTGSNADRRTRVKPSQQGNVAAALLNEINGQGHVAGLDEAVLAAVKSAAADLKSAGAKGLVVAGDNDLATQGIVNAINQALGAVGTTVEIHAKASLHQGDDAAFAQLVEDMQGGRVSALIVDGINPAYHGADAEGFKAGLEKVAFSVSTALYADETASRCKAIAPNHHWLESWNDLQIDPSRIDIAQPTIKPLYDTRHVTESLVAWAGQSVDAYTFIRQTHSAAYTAEAMYTDQNWNTGVHNGFLAVEAAEETVPAYLGTALAGALAEVKGRKGGGFELALYRKTAMGDGQQAANPMLQETPDPITKTTWDNYVTMAVSDMKEMGLNTYIAQEDPASVVRVTVGDLSVELPAFPQPGQAPGTVGIALGYGRGADGEAIGRAAFQVDGSGDHMMDAEGNLVPIGANAFPMATLRNGAPDYNAYDVTVEGTGGTYPLACTQIQHTYMGRDSVVKETTFDSYLAESGADRGQASWNKTIGLNVHDDINGDGEINALDKKAAGEFDLWHEHAVDGVGHRWGMAIDLTSCIGCSACVTACHIENNVPVVGKDEVRRHRDMHWMRIDRFYASEWDMERGEEEGLGVISTYGKMEEPGSNPQTVHMPMMCQHCNHAPCETVCPVAATTHSNEGVNQMTYNRCIGTRYCANNCPFKVRRFNWFHYPGYDKFQNFNPAQDAIQRMVLNPDVVVRSRGVMEKCSLCVQRTQSAKLEAKKAGAPLEDGAVLTACAEACPTNAITFGDLNDTNSEVRATYDNNRTYHALEEVGIQPNVAYLTKVRNTPNS
jgi:molybdopterin-containing oxidoreductase family iron-sulfur binding subunit